MNILFQLNHPAHYHMFKHAVRQLSLEGHQVHIVIKSKDILESLLKDSGIPFYNIQPKSHRKNYAGILYDTFLRTWKTGLYVIRYHIDVLVGSTPEVAQVGWLLRRRRINLLEDDAAIIPQLIRFIKPFSQICLAPSSCNTGPLEKKTIHYPGYQKLAYLHPSRFEPDKNIASKYVDTTHPFILLRIVALKAYHDIGNHAKGMDLKTIQRIIDLFRPVGNIYISAERPLEPTLEPYRLDIAPIDIHHVMAYATLYAGDSQSMAVEAAMLGIPSIRISTFAGRIGVLEELEKSYGLTFGFQPSETEKAIEKIKEILTMDDSRTLFQHRRQRMLSEKIDVTDFIVRQIEMTGAIS